MKKRVMTKWSKERIKRELTQISEELGHSLSTREASFVLCEASKRYFGSFNKAKIVCNLSITPLKNNKLSKKAVLLSKELAYILGVVYGDGNVHTHKDKVRSSGWIALKVKDKDFALEFKRTLEKWSNFDIKSFLDKRGFYHTVLYSRNAAIFVMNFDLNRVLEAPNKVKYFFLKGLFDSEGTVAGSNLDILQKATRYVGFYNNNKEIVDIVSSLLKGMGMKHSIRSRIHSGFGSKKVQYELIIAGSQNMYIFYKRIGFSINRKQERLKKVLNSYKIYPKLISGG